MARPNGGQTRFGLQSKMSKKITQGWLIQNIKTETTVKQEPLQEEEEEEEEEFVPETFMVVKNEPLLPNLGFDSSEQVSTNNEVENGGPALTCPKCGIRYYSKYSIKNHIQVCKKVCPQLEKDKFVEKKDEKNHVVFDHLVVGGVRKTGEEQRQSIRILEQSCFVNEDQGLDESRDMETAQCCVECDEYFDNKRLFARHLYAHTFIRVDEADMPCICTACGFEFPNREDLNGHTTVDKCGGEAKIMYPCQLCDKIFTRKDNLRDDLRGHVGKAKKKRPYNCKKCNKSYGGTSLLLIHVKSHLLRKSQGPKMREKRKVVKEKKKKKLFQCDTCHVEFKDFRELKKHGAIHDNYCGKKYERTKKNNELEFTYKTVKQEPGLEVQEDEDLAEGIFIKQEPMD